MNKTIWTCWFQGRENAPDLVQRCISSWEKKNPGWSLRCLDAATAGLYADVGTIVDLERQAVTAASLSDILRILLLREYGGVWVDATLYCNRPLDEWLADVFGRGFFAFATPGEDRLLSSWFIATTPDNHILTRWHASVARYWSRRSASDDYFWFHHQFTDMCESDPELRQLWDEVPKISADGPHSIEGLSSDSEGSAADVDWATPVFKLTHRMRGEDYREGHLAYDLLHREDSNGTAAGRDTTADRDGAVDEGLLAVLVQARIESPDEQIEVLVVSPDDWFVTSIRNEVGTFRRVSPVMDEAQRLELYRTRAKVVVTTMARCALQAIGTGVPVVTFFPPGRGGERARLTALRDIVPVFELEQKRNVDWRGYGADVGYVKRLLREATSQCATETSTPIKRRPLGPIAPPEALPLPES